MKSPKLKGTYSVTSRIELNATQEEVWAVLAEFSTVSAWAPQVKESHAIGKGENCVGAGRHCVLDGFGAIDEIITRWEEGTGFVYSVTPLGPLHQAQSSWWLTPTANNKCQLEVVFSYDIRFGLFGKMMHKMIMRKKLEGSLPETLDAVKIQVQNVKDSYQIAA